MTPDEFRHLLDNLAETPDALRRLLNDLSADELTSKPGAQQFSALENICHLRDIEAEGYALRIGRLLAGGHPFMEDLDGTKLAAERHYNEQSLDSALRVLTETRQDNLRQVKDLSQDQLSFDGILENVGPINLEGLLLMMYEHDRAHLEELSRLRASLRGHSLPPLPS
jgi:hypothetical protein